MKTWKIAPPTPSALGDHDVPTLGNFLEGKNIALLVSGGIAAIKAPLIARQLRRYKANVIVYVSEEALRYTTVDSLEWASVNPVVKTLTAQAEHLAKQCPIDIFLVAPATYNTINKIRYGIADTPLTTTAASALTRVERGEAQMLIAPTMHGDLHNSVLQESLEHLQKCGVQICPPRDEYGKHNLPDPEILAAYVCHLCSQNPLKEKNFLIQGVLASESDVLLAFANQLFFKGADVTLVGKHPIVQMPPYLNWISESDFSISKQENFDRVLNSNDVLRKYSDPSDRAESLDELDI